MTAGELVAACILDAAVGDPRWLPHPVGLMGWCIAWYERRVRSVIARPAQQFLAGLVLAAAIPTLAYGSGWVAIALAGAVQETFGKFVEVWLAFTTLAGRDLADHVIEVRQAAALDQARMAISRLVGRDTEHLSEQEVVRAAVETVAESTADGIIAPLFYLMLGGAPMALAYKAINTLDSMVGHPEPPYRYFGWGAARLDDLVNWLPARITAFLIVVCAGLVVRKIGVIKQAVRILWRDGGQHPSPNSGRPEAAMAGALGVQLGGMNYYGGRPEQRPQLGDALRPLTRERINESLKVMWAVYGLALLAGIALLR